MPTIRVLFALIATVFGILSAQAQFSKTIHSTFEADDATSISFELAGNVSYDTWAGNTVLVQTDIRLYNATKGIFNYFIEQAKRYDLESSLVGETLRIASVHPEREIIQSKLGSATEEVNIKVLIPSTFVGQEGGPYTRQAVDSGR